VLCVFFSFFFPGFPVTWSVWDPLRYVMANVASPGDRVLKSEVVAP
jgi:hypothetical protein